jgi:hypothetical protein
MPYVSFDKLGSPQICGEFPEGFKHHALSKDAKEKEQHLKWPHRGEYI